MLRLHYFFFWQLFFISHLRIRGKGSLIHLFVLLLARCFLIWKFIEGDVKNNTVLDTGSAAWRRDVTLSHTIRSSRLLHQESQLKKWRVMEMERIIRTDMRLYTIGKISEELVFSFSIDCIIIIFFIDCLYIYIKTGCNCFVLFFL